MKVLTNASIRLMPIFVFALIINLILPQRASGQYPNLDVPTTPQPPSSNTITSHSIFIPLVKRPATGSQPVSLATITRRVNAPKIGYRSDGEARLADGAIFWFGEVDAEQNYADVRIGYTTEKLHIRVAIFDRQLWYNKKPSGEPLTSWDAVSLFIDTAGNQGGSPQQNSLMFVGQLNWWEPRTAYQAVYRGTDSSWQAIDINYEIKTGWRGEGMNDNEKLARGWTIQFNIPFSSLGSSEPPEEGVVWGLGISLHDRDSAEGPAHPVKSWPEKLVSKEPKSWGQLVFGLPRYTLQVIPETNDSVNIRHGKDGIQVKDGMVGGGSICGEGLSYWKEWGETSYPGEEQVNIQNQGDVADWPCFSKYYISMPLDPIPEGKVIISATFTLYHFDNAGGGKWDDPIESLIHALIVKEDWEEAKLNWNNAPLPVENISQARVPPVEKFAGWPGIPITWDVSNAVAGAYERGEPLRLVFYSSDYAYHSGKYFSASSVGDWNASGRPTLEVVWGEP
jgi:hypothetical protein